jgi:hypothetical protein
MVLDPFQETGTAAVLLKRRVWKPIIRDMSWRTAVGIIILIALVLGVSKLLGRLGEKHDPSDSYLHEMVHTTKKVRELKEERSKLIEEQESNLLDEE